MFDDLSDEEKMKLKAYTDQLDNADNEKQIHDIFKADADKRQELQDLSGSVMLTPEEQMSADYDPLNPEFINQMVPMGTVGRVAKPLANEVVPAFRKLKQMMSIGNKSYPVKNTAQGLTVRDALQQTGEALPSKYGRVIIKD